MADQGISTVLGNGFVIRNGKIEVQAGTVGTTSGTVAAGDDPRITGAASAAAVSGMLAAFRAELISAGVPLTGGGTPAPTPPASFGSSTPTFDGQPITFGTATAAATPAGTPTPASAVSFDGQPILFGA